MSQYMNVSLGRHEHEWSQRGDVGDKWSECWLCGEVRNGWEAAQDATAALVSDPIAPDVDLEVQG